MICKTNSMLLLTSSLLLLFCLKAFLVVFFEARAKYDMRQVCKKCTGETYGTKMVTRSLWCTIAWPGNSQLASLHGWATRNGSSYQCKSKGEMSSRLPSDRTVRMKSLKPVWSPSWWSSGDDDTNLRLSSRNTLGHKRNHGPKLKQPREIVRKNTSVGMEAKWCKQKMAESF